MMKFSCWHKALLIVVFCSLASLAWADGVSNTTAPVLLDASVSVLSPPPPLTSRDKKQADDEMKQGADAAAQVAKEVKFVDDKTMNDRVNRIGQRLGTAANTTQYPAGFGNNKVYPFAWHFHIIQDKQVNAFSLPGGYVYVNSGLLKTVRSDDELAGVLGHEITHSAHHHIQELSHEESKLNTEMIVGMLAAVLAHVPAQDMANLANAGQLAQLGFINFHYSQPAERDADHGGTILMQRAGFNPVGMLTFMERLGDFESNGPQIQAGILQDHPAARERISAITAELAAMHVTVTPRAVREVTGAPHAAVLPVGVGVDSITFDSRTLPTLADSDGTRAQTAVTEFNTLLDNGLELYQISAADGAVLLSDKPFLTFTSADVALHPGETADSLAQKASETLRSALWASSFPTTQASGGGKS